jgi:RNA polymerase sigma factor (TIGR02999 family)
VIWYRHILAASPRDKESKANMSESASPPDITQMLQAWSDGKDEVLNQLMPLVYEELRRQAARYLRRERQDHTLQTTGLIHEAYLKLVDQREVKWQSRTHFFAIAAQAMRRILVDYARSRQRAKRGGDDVRVSLTAAEKIVSDNQPMDLIALDEALTRLAAIDQQSARVVELRYFSGLSLEETATILKISRATAAREWSMAQAWLRRELTR